MSTAAGAAAGTENDDSGTPVACVPYNPAVQLSTSNCLRSRAAPDQPDSAVRRSPLNTLDSGRPVKGQGTGRPGAGDPTREYVLPAEIPGEPVLPAKIAFDDERDRYFVSSLFDGSIYRGRSGEDKAELFLPGVLPLDLNGSFGVQVDDRNRLYVLNSAQSAIEVDDADTGARLATFHAGLSTTGFIDSAAVAPNGDVYITDSLRPASAIHGDLEVGVS